MFFNKNLTNKNNIASQKCVGARPATRDSCGVDRKKATLIGAGDVFSQGKDLSH